MLPRGDNAFLGIDLFSWCNDNSYDLSVVLRLLNNRKRHILLSQEKQSSVCELPAPCHASPLLLGIYQKVSLRLTARVFPQKFPPSISLVQGKRHFVDFSVCWR